MFSRLRCSLCGLSCFVALLGGGPAALGQESEESVLAALSAVDDEDDDLAPDGERDELVQAPAVQRPQACGAELQNHIRVAGTVYDAQRPERSMALMGVASAPSAGLYRSGSRFGSHELLEVRPHAVLLSTDREDSPCWLKMERPNPNAPPPAPASADEKKSEKKKRKKVFSSEELARDIQKIGPGVYRVSRSVLDRALAGAPKLARSIRTKSVKKDGQRVGVALTRVESGGLFEHLGLKKGDVLRTVNGFDMSSIDGMLSARTQLTAAKRLSLALERDGQRMTLEYRVH